MSSAPDKARLQRLLGGEALAGLRERLRKRYTSAAAQADEFTLARITEHERAALAGLLGRPARRTASMRLSHEEIDAALQRAELAPNLRLALECLDGPIVDHGAQRERARQEWGEVFAAVREAILAEALNDSAFQGVIKRLAAGDPEAGRRILDGAAQVLAQLPASGISRSRLAAQTLGDAHGLDHGRAVATVLTRVLDPERALPTRDVWATQGVLVSALAKPVALINLAATGLGPTDRLVQCAAHAGEPLHLSLRALLQQRASWRGEQHVFVCENPDVIAAAADAFGPNCPPMVSLDGQVSAAPRALLDQLHAAECAFAYHGDFDWPGVRIANGVIERYGASPWRYSSADYHPAQGPALGDDTVEARWDGDLAAKMRAAGVAVHEESQLSELLEALAGFND